MCKVRRSFFIAVLILLFSGISYVYPQSGGAYIGDKKHYYGTAYYPEAWDFGYVDQDIERMKELGMNVMRIGEFAWSSMEPTEGNFTFKWLHDVIEKLHSNGIDVVLGTPTATPPAWLAHKHPEIFVVDDRGVPKTHGHRRNCNYASEVYREYSRKIIREMAREFGNKPGVIGWQTDNEFSLNFDYSEETRTRWHQWLRERYRTIENVNSLWGLALWSQHYNSFEQIPLPKTFMWHNPSIQLAWYRFNNDMVVEYQDIHIEAIREFSDLPITHDSMPGQRLDYVQLFEDLDFMAFNVYHGWQAMNRIPGNYDRMRGYGKGFHWLFETAPNNSGGGPQGQTWFIHQPDGAMRAAVWINHALGGQGSLFWLWRQHWAGHEMPHGSIINAWNKPAANYEDLKQVGHELAQTSDFLLNAPVEEAEAAIFYCHTTTFMLGVENYSNGINYYIDWTNRFYRPIADAFIHRDVIHPGADISGYKLIFAPLLPYMPEQTRKNLMKWVEEDGGTLIAGPMTGYRTHEWTSFTDYALGDLEPWMNIFVQSRIPVEAENPLGYIPLMLDFDPSTGLKDQKAELWSESLSVPDGKVLARYEGGMHKGLPAIAETQVGNGKVVFLGTYPGYDAYKWIVENYAQEAGIQPLASGDKDLVLAPRKGRERGMVIVNLTNEEKSVTLNENRYFDVLSGRRVRSSNVELNPFDVKILRFDN